MKVDVTPGTSPTQPDQRPATLPPSFPASAAESGAEDFTMTTTETKKTEAEAETVAYMRKREVMIAAVSMYTENKAEEMGLSDDLADRMRAEVCGAIMRVMPKAE
jgi:hypothetical protein